MDLPSFKKKLSGQLIILVVIFIIFSAGWEFYLKDQALPLLMSQIPLQGHEVRWLGVLISTLFVLLAVVIPAGRLTRFAEKKSEEILRCYQLHYQVQGNGVHTILLA